MAKNIVHEGGPGSVMPWTNNTGSVVASGALVIAGNTIGVALVNIANGDVGSVAIEGVVSGVPKTAGHAWGQGEKVLWDSSAAAFDYRSATPAANDVAGGAIAWIAAASGDTTGTIKLTPGNTAVGADSVAGQVANLNTWAAALATKLNADAGVTDTNYDTDPQA